MQVIRDWNHPEEAACLLSELYSVLVATAILCLEESKDKQSLLPCKDHALNR